MAEQCITIQLHSTHSFLELRLTMSKYASQRVYRIIPSAHRRSLRAVSAQDPRKPVFEVPLRTGVNRIEFEVVAGPPRGATNSGSAFVMDHEKIILIAFLMKPSRS